MASGMLLNRVEGIELLKNSYFQIIDAIKSAHNILIISHIGPDGDTIGSTLALTKLIQDNFDDKNVHFVVQHKIPDIYKFLPDVHNAILDNRNVEISCYDLAIAVDCAKNDRMGYFEPIYNRSKYRINIDHHITNPEFGDLNVINADFASCGEIIFNFAETTGLNISLETAVCLYTAILTDTGGFRYSNTTANSLLMGAKLVETGVNPNKVYEACYEHKPKEMLAISSYAVLNAVYLENNKISYAKIDRQLLKQFNALDEHLEGISEVLRQAKEVEVAFVAKETVKGEAKFSFRSKSLDVAKLCNIFGGGGHKLAAGCIIKKPLDEALNDMLPEVIKLVKTECL